MIERFDRFLSNIAEIDLYWHRLATAEMARYGLRGTCAVYFTRLSGAPEGLTSAQLAAMCGKDKADVSRDIAVMERAGLVTRVLADGKAYRARIKLTEAGGEVAAAVRSRVEVAMTCIASDLDVRDREAMYRALDAISGNLHRLSESGWPDQTKEAT